MAVAAMRLPVHGQREPANDCCPVRCSYAPRVIAYVMRVCGLLERQGYDPAEALSSVLDPHQGYDRDRESGVFGPTMEARWILYRADVQRAMAAGCTSAEEISAWLCPFGGIDQES